MHLHRRELQVAVVGGAEGEVVAEEVVKKVLVALIIMNIIPQVCIKVTLLLHGIIKVFIMDQ
jgi:hypothetical protein